MNRRILFGFILLVLLGLSGCSGRSEPTPTPTPSRREQVESALALVNQQLESYEERRAALSKEIAETEGSMPPALREEKLTEYQAYRQILIDLREYRSQLELALARVETQAALGEVEESAEQRREVDALLYQILEIEPSMQESVEVDTEALMTEIRQESSGAATSVTWSSPASGERSRTDTSASVTARFVRGSAASFSVYEEGGLTVHIANLGDVTNDRTTGLRGWSSVLAPRGSSIAFVADRDGDEQIFRVDKIGAEPTSLTDLPGMKSSLVWSVDDRQLAFVANPDSASALYTVAATGDGVRQVVGPALGNISSVSWHPSGRTLLFTSEDDNGPRVYSVHTDGSNLTRLTDFNSGHGSWSADGSLILIASEYGIYSIDALGQSRQRLTETGAVQAAWSYDGTLIAFLSDSGSNSAPPELWIMESDGRQQRRLTVSGCYGFQWSVRQNELIYLIGTAQSDPSMYQAWKFSLASGTSEYLFETNEPHISWIHP